MSGMRWTPAVHLIIFVFEYQQLFIRWQSKDAFRPFRASLTLTLSQRERESYCVPIYSQTTNKALRMVCIGGNNNECQLVVFFQVPLSLWERVSVRDR